MVEEILTLFQLEFTDIGMICICIALFCIYWQFSSALLFEPLLKLLEERERLTEGAKESATEALAEAEKLEAIYNESINAARSEAVTKRLETIAAASKRSSETVGAAESEAKTTIANGRAELQKLEERLKGDLEKDTESLARQLADRILSGGGAGAQAGRFSPEGVLFLLISSGLLALFIAFSPIDAWAAAKGGVPSIADTFKYWPNFICFVFLLFYLTRKPFKQHWVNRAESLAEAANAGEKARIEAQAALEAAEARYANIDEEVKELAAGIAQEGANESALVIEDGQSKARNIKERAEQSLESEKNTLEARLRDELATRVIKRAQELVKGELNAEGDQKLRSSVLNNVQNVLN